RKMNPHAAISSAAIPNASVPPCGFREAHGAGQEPRARRRVFRAVRRPRRALTLLEVIIAISLIALLLAILLTFFVETVRMRGEVASAADRSQLARQVLSLMAKELRGTVGFDEVGFPLESRLVGDRRSITFLTTALPSEEQYVEYGEFDDPPPARHDLTEVRYWLWIDPEETDEDGEPIVGGIIRTEKKTLNQFVVEEDDPYDVRNDLWSHELGYLEFRYFDGVEWDTKWELSQGNSLPQMIQITVGFDNITSYELEDQDLEDYPIEEYPFGPDLPDRDRYSVIVRIPAADKFFGSRVERVGRQLAEQMGVEGLP
ncbi:MAG: prepilin-type N-terminal cleavage/methylation domain-containing protein, partial [Planctomycetota bacterium]